MNASAETGGQIPGEPSIEGRLAAVQDQIAEAAKRVGRDAAEEVNLRRVEPAAVRRLRGEDEHLPARRFLTAAF